MPKFSIIIPTYNRKSLLKDRALSSLLNQNLKNFEVIVINDGGEDIIEVIEEFRQRGLSLKYINNSSNNGPSFARNLGVAQSSGEWICFLDDDDEYINNATEILINIVQKTFKRVLFFPHYKIINGKKFLMPKSNGINVDENKILEWVIKWYFISGTYVIKKEVFNKIKFDENIKIGEDLELGINLLRNLKDEIAFVEEPFYLHYFRKSDFTNVHQALEDYKKILEKHKKFLKEKEVLHEFYYRLGCFSYFNSNRLEALKYFLYSIKRPRLKIFFRIFLLFIPLKIGRIIEDFLLELKLK